jgi:hypothetical protein
VLEARGIQGHSSRTSKIGRDAEMLAGGMTSAVMAQGAPRTLAGGFSRWFAAAFSSVQIAGRSKILRLESSPARCRAAIAIERLPRCRCKHVFHEADIASARPSIISGTFVIITPVCHPATSASMRCD